MLNNKLIVLLGFIILLFASCSSGGESGKAMITGHIDGAEGTNLYLDKYLYDAPIASIAKVPVDANGDFTLEMENPWETAIYRFRVGRNSFKTIISDTDSKITLNGTADQFDNYAIKLTGTAEGILLHTWMNNIHTKKWSLKDLGSELQKDNNALVEMVAAVESNRLRNKESATALYASAKEQLKKDMPGSSYAKQLTRISAKIDAETRARASKARTIVGAIPPPIEQKNPEGKIIRLEDLKGKVVLIDFWASWCGPCRRANPGIVALYKKYNSKGFEIFNVSLDKNKGKWINAIAKDKLSWPYHVSDLKGWQSIHAKDYGVKSIPSTFLLDRDGNIAAVNLRDKLKLEAKINELL